MIFPAAVFLSKKRIMFLPLFIILAALFFFSVYQSFKTPFFIPFRQEWAGYRILFLSEELHNRETLAELEKTGYALISYYTNPLVYYDYPNISRINLSELDKRFEDSDPRLDTFIRESRRYFHIPGEEFPWIVYIETEISLTILRDILSNLLPEEGWKLSGSGRSSSPVYKGLIYLIIAAAVVLMFFRAKKQDLGYILGLLPWIGLIIKEPSVYALPVVLCYFWWVFLYRQGKASLPYLVHNPLSGRRGADFKTALLCYFLTSVLCVFIAGFAAREPWAALFFFWGTFASVILILLYFLLILYLSLNREHRLFYMETFYRKKSRDYSPASPSLYLCLVLILSFLPYLFQDTASQAMPLPYAVSDLSDFSWASVQASEACFEPGDLPNLYTYITHRAFQESFPYRREFLFPDPEETITISRYKRNNGTIEREEYTVKQFTEKWYSDIIRDANTEGISRLLIRQGKPVRVVISRPQKGFYGGRISLVFLGILTFSPLLFIGGSLKGIIPLKIRLVSRSKKTDERLKYVPQGGHSPAG